VTSLIKHFLMHSKLVRFILANLFLLQSSELTQLAETHNSSLVNAGLVSK